MKYFQTLEKRMAKKWAKDEDFAKVSNSVRVCGGAYSRLKLQ